MSIKISELPQATSVSSNDIVPIVQGGTTKQADISKFSNASSVPMGATFQYDGDTIPTGYEEVNGLETYSTTEQKVGTWINGKPLYEKVITNVFPTINDGQSSSAAYDVAADIDYAFIVNGWFETGNNYRVPLTYVDTGANFASLRIGLTATPTKLVAFGNSGAVSGKTFYAVVRYTKTTDSAS